MSQIKVTSNYSKFKHLKGNRNIVEPHLRKLIKSIQENGWLENSPVLVNQKYEIIDGQHRFEACKTLGLPIEYMVVYDENLSTCIVRNNTARKWTATDFVRAKAAEGNDDFKLLLSYIEKYPAVPVPEIFITLGMNKATLDFNWSYTMHGEEIQYLEELEWYAETFSKRRSFIHAVYLILIYGGVDWKTLRKQMFKRGLPKPLAATATDTVRQLQDVYNYNLNEKNRVYFADEISKISKSTDLRAKRAKRQAEVKNR